MSCGGERRLHRVRPDTGVTGGESAATDFEKSRFGRLNDFFKSCKRHFADTKACIDRARKTKPARSCPTPCLRVKSNATEKPRQITTGGVFSLPEREPLRAPGAAVVNRSDGLCRLRGLGCKRRGRKCQLVGREEREELRHDRDAPDDALQRAMPLDEPRDGRGNLL